MVSGVAKVTLLVMIFAVIFAGTLSGAFGIESLAIKEAQLDGIEGNLTDTVGVADAANPSKTNTATAYLSFDENGYDHTKVSPPAKVTTNADYTKYMTWESEYDFGDQDAFDEGSWGFFTKEKRDAQYASVSIFIRPTDSVKWAIENGAVGSMKVASTAWTYDPGWDWNDNKDALWESINLIGDGNFSGVAYNTGTQLFTAENGNGTTNIKGIETTLTPNSTNFIIRISAGAYEARGGVVDRPRLFFGISNERISITVNKNDTTGPTVQWDDSQRKFIFSDSSAGLRSVEYNTDGSSNYTSIFTATSNTKTWNWALPNTSNYNYTFKITDNLGNVTTQTLNFYNLLYNANGAKFGGAQKYVNASGSIVTGTIGNSFLCKQSACTITDSWYLKDNKFFTKWNSASNSSGTSIEAGGKTPVNWNAINNNSATLYAQYADIAFTFNGKTYTADQWNTEKANGGRLVMIAGQSNYLSGAITVSGYNVQINYSSGGTTAPTAKGEYTATITVYKESATRPRGQYSINFTIMDTDFGSYTGSKDSTWGTKDNPFVIDTLERLGNLHDIVNGKRPPVDSVTGKSLSKTASTNASNITYSGCFFLVKALTDGEYTLTSPIGDYSVDPDTNERRIFSGTFYGGTGAYTADNYKNRTNVEISLNITVDAYYAGLFGYTDGATIENITVTGNITAKGVVGGIVGYANDTKIHACQNMTTRIWAKGPSTKFGSLPEEGAVMGGIVGYLASGEISHCYSQGTIITLKDADNLNSGEFAGGGTNFLGGIVGFTNGDVSYCYAENSLYGSHYIGGIVGDGATSITYCYFNGKLYGLWNGSGASVGYISGKKGETYIPNNTNLLLPNVSASTYIKNANGSFKKWAKQDDSENAVTYKQQAPKVTVGGGVTIVPAYNNGSWTALDDWTEICKYDVVGINVYKTIANGEYLRIYDGTNLVPANADRLADEVRSATTPYASTTGYKAEVFFNANRTNANTEGNISVDVADFAFDEGSVFSAINIDKGTNTYEIIKTYNGEGQVPAISWSVGSVEYMVRWFFEGTANDGTQYSFAQYENNSEKLAPHLAKDDFYGAKIEVLVNGKVVGRTVDIHYFVNRLKLTFDVDKTDYTNSANNGYVYNGEHQGYTSIVATNVISKDSVADILIITSTNTCIIKDGTLYEFDGAVNAGNYSVNVKLSGSDLSKNYEFDEITYTWEITPKTLSLTTTATSAQYPSFVYNGKHQGLTELVVEGIADGKSANAILSVTTDWETKPDFSGNTYTFSNAINARKYTVTLTVNDRNYQLPAYADKEEWTISTYAIRIEAHALGSSSALNLGGKKFTYNMQKQGPVELQITPDIYDDIKNVISVSFDGGFTDDTGKVLATKLNMNGTKVFMNAINAGEYSVTVKLNVDNPISANYTIQYTYANAKSEGSSVNDTYQWKIDPKTISVDGFAYTATLEDGNGHKYGDGSVTNNAFLGRGYLLSRIGHTRIALVYQGDKYVFDNFEVTATFFDNNNKPYWEYLRLAGSGTAEGFNTMNFKATFTAKNSDGTTSSGNVTDINSISLLGADLTPKTFELKFESIDKNYIFDESNDTIVYTLLISDFGGHFDQPNWGSQDNPFVISTEAHLLRLSQIVNGAVAWNSINNTDMCVTQNPNALSTITARTYANAFFSVENNITVTDKMGFEPIGGHGTDQCPTITIEAPANGKVTAKGYFSGNLRGVVEGGKNKYTIRVAQQRTDDYVGLFGILKDAAILDINIVAYGSANASGVPNASMIGRNYVGAVAGYAENVTIKNVMTGESTAQDEGSWIKATGDYVGGIVGMYKAPVVTDFNEEIGIIDVYARMYGYIGRNYVGGIAGLSVGGRIANPNVAEHESNRNERNGVDYVGGIAGKIESTAIIELGWDANTSDITGAFFTGWLHGVKYVGTIAGHWTVTDGRQVNGERNLLSQGNQNMYVKGDTFVGGLAGYFDASNCVGGLTITPKLIGVSELAHNSMTVTGANYVGSLFGVFIGSGYKKTSAEYNANTDTLLLVAGNSNGKYNISATVNIQGETPSASKEDAKANVIGGLVGYIANAGIAFTTEYGYMNGATGNYNPVELRVLDNSTGYKEVTEINFVGMIAGIMGENSTIECTQPDGTNGNYNQILLITAADSLKGKKNDFVGRIAGYVASNAGIKNGESGTMFGNRMIVVSAGSTNGHNYVGGLFGAIGKASLSGNTINDSINIPYSNASSSTTKEEYRLLYYALSGRSLKTNTESTTTLVFGPRAQAIGESGQPYGRIANLGNVTGNYYIGGIAGAVLENARLEFVNPQWDGVTADETSATSGDIVTAYDNAYQFKNNNTYIYSGGVLNSGDKPTYTDSEITGAQYVGGIAGYLGSGAHMLERVVSRVIFKKEDAKYVGGIAGYMKSGTIQNCMTPYVGIVTGITIDTYDTYKGSENVGGIVGYMESGKIVDSISTGMRFDGFADSKNTVGGVVGYATQNAKVENSWAIFVSAGPDDKSGPTYASTPANEWGKYVVIRNIADNKTNFIPNYVELARMIGLYNFGVSALSSNASSNDKPDGVDLSAEYGELSLGANVPTNNLQLVFYNASGRDVVTDNKFEVFKTYTGKLYMRFKAFGEGAQNSMIVTTTDVKFANIAPWRTGQKDSEGNLIDKLVNAQNGYVKPSNSDKYVAEVTGATYYNEGTSDTAQNATNHNIWKITANIYFNDTLVGTADEYKQKQVGHYQDTFTPGSSADSPYVIASQQDWDDFAYNIYSGTKTYKDEFVKMTTDITIDTKNNKFTGNNQGYNVAGNLAYGEDSSNDPTNRNFQGTFDGNGHTITIDGASVGNTPRMSAFPNAGVAGTTTNIKNLTIEGNITTGKDYKESSNAYDLAAFVGKPFGNITFENCTSAVNIIGRRNIGGFVGYVSSQYKMEFIACVNTGNIESLEGSYTLGGRDNATYSYDDGWSNTGYTYGTGGLIGTLKGELTIESCRNAGNVIGGHNVGGIIGLFEDGKLTVNSCGNTGNVLANSGYTANNITARGDKFDVKDEGGVDCGSSRGVRKNIYGYAGGLIGKTGQNAYLQMFYSYNSGEIITYANIVGGLVGGIGTLYNPKGEKNKVLTKDMSTVAYCYNTGTVRAGGTFPKHTDHYIAGRENFAGTVSGGIAGIVGKVLVTQCYNAGDIYSYGVIGYGGSWQFRSGGIVGQNEPLEDGDVKYSYVYNVGSICCRAKDSSAPLGTFWMSDNLRYGASIAGYCDDGFDNAKYVKADHVYSIAYPVSVKTAPGETSDDDCMNNGEAMCVDEKRGDWLYNGGVLNIGAAKENAVIAGSTYDSFEQLTAFMNSDGTIKPRANGLDLAQSTKSLTEKITTSNIPSGWLYVYGCLPQLAVFALGTQNGLSMRSIGYGRDIYGNFVQNQAGGQEYPFLIRDGIDMLGMSALTNLGYSFEGKHIEFANADNNLDKLESKYIEMPTDVETPSGGNLASTNAYKAYDGNEYKIGKSYHLFSMGALCNTAYNDKGAKIGTDKEYDVWVGNNCQNIKGGTGNASSATKGAALGEMNYYPAGMSGEKVFSGSISGRQKDGNTTIRGLRMHMKYITNYAGYGYVYAGLFGRTQSGTIGYITVDGTITALGDGDECVIAGGIVGIAGGETTIDHCKVEGITIEAKHSGNGNSYVGGIVGIITNEFYKGTEKTHKVGSHTVVSNCEVTFGIGIRNDGTQFERGTTIKACSSNAGGIAGYSTATRTDGTVMSGSYVEIENCKVNSATITDFSTDAKNVANLGGIISTSDKNISLTIKGCSVGDSKTVIIYGSYALGGVMGAVTGNTRIEGTVVGAKTEINRTKNVDINDEKYKEYSTAIGGLVGYSADSTNERVLTFGGTLGFAGKIKIQTTNTTLDSNVGGIIGYMGSGAVFEDGSDANITGTIDFSSAGTVTRKNIGGVAGITKDVEFIGTFVVNPKMELGSAIQIENIGGFIGLNDGICSIIADDQIVKLVAEGEVAAEGGTHITIGGEIGSSKADNVGGFIGNNNNTLNIGPDEANGVRYDGEILIITISGQITGHDNVGGFVGNNPNKKDSAVGIDVKKGDIKISGGTITGNDCVGGIIGNNTDKLTTGGSVIPGATLSITNEGAVNGHNKVGGVFGHLENANIADTFTNGGSVSSSGAAVLTGIYDNGVEVEAGASFVGGVIGFMKDSTIYGGKFTNSGTVSATLNKGDNKIGNYIGGVIGYMDNSSITGGEFINEGAVSGNQYVGGSIGFVVKTSTITNKDSLKDIKFVNGAVQTTTPSNPEAQTAVEGAQTSADNGKISGNIFVGGSIGIMRGSIIGAENRKVQFDNLGTVGGYEKSLVYYVGGSVAIITGSVDYAVFSNRSKDMTVSGANIVGGSIGIIIGAEDAPAKIDHTHFEFTGELTVTDSQGGWNEDTQKSNFVGIGGSIGVINQATWGETNTFYSSGQVEATGIVENGEEKGAENVGGSIGLIAQAGITISNMLAYETTVIGRENVGGIVGATTAQNTIIENSFNVRGTVEGINAGGIIGKAMDDTDASTSYWVKAEDNINLEKTDINNLNASLGKNQNVKIDGTDLSDTVPSPIEYIDNKILSRDCKGSADKDKASFGKDVTEFTITTTYTLDVKFTVGDQTATIQIVRTDTVTYGRVVDEDDNVLDTETKHLKAYTYKIGETTGNIVEDVVDADGNITTKGTNNWNALLEMTELKGKYTYTNGYYVYSTSTTTYSTGNATTGWYFVYSNTQKEGYINAIHSEFSRKVTYDKITQNDDGTTTTEEKSYTFGGDKASVAERDRQAWKYIANAYTAEEKAFIARAKVGADGKRMDKVVTNLVKEGSDFNADHVFATATVGRDVIDNGVTSSYYLYVATSGKDEVTKNPVKPTLAQGKVDTNKEDTAKEDGYFVDFVTYLTGETRRSVENIAIYYRKLQYKTSIVYNGYDRVAPITDNSDTFTKAGYDFSSFLKKEDGTQDSHIAVGTYTSNGTVLYENADGAKLPMSGNVSFEWKITEKEITITTNTSKGGSYGGGQNAIIVTAEGISPKSNKNEVEFLHLVIGVYSKSVDDNNLVAYVVVYKVGDDWDDWDVELWDKSFNKTEDDSKIKELKVTPQKGNKFGATGASYTAESAGISSSTTWTNLEVSMKLMDAKTYVLNYKNTYDTPVGVKKDLKNYRLTAKNATVKVEPKELTVKFLSGSPTNRMYDGQKNSTGNQPMWTIDGWYNNESLVTSYTNGSTSKAYWEWFNIGVIYVSKDGKTVTDLGKISKGDITTSNKVIQYGAGIFQEVGNYMLQFNGMPSVSNNKYVMGNYYIKLDSGKTSGIDKDKRSIAYTIGQIKIVIKNIEYDKTAKQHEYDGSTIGKATFVFEIQYDGKAKEMNQDFVNIINSYYQVDGSTKFVTKAFNAKQVGDLAKATFETNVDADTYNINLKVVATDSQKANCAPDDTASMLKATYKITQRPLNFSYGYTTGGPTYTYTTGHQGVNKVTINNAIGNDDVKVILSIKNETTGWSTETSALGSGNITGITTSDVGNYSVKAYQLSGNDAKNYEIGSNVAGTWNITPKVLTLSNVSGSAVYDGKPHEPSLTISDCTNGVFADKDIITLSYTIDGASAGEMIDAGTYKLHYDPSKFIVKRKDGKTTGDNNGDLVVNYTISGSAGDIEYTISKAQLTLEWSTETLYYNGSAQGHYVETVRYANGAPSGKSGSVQLYASDVLTITLSQQGTNAGTHTMYATVGGDRKNNYEIKDCLPENEYKVAHEYTISKAKVAIGTVTGSDTTKVYDATTKYDGAFSVSWNKVLGDYAMKSSDYSISGVYDVKDVGNRKINYTVTISNSNVECDVKTGSIDGSITAKELTVELDKLRNGKATKAYDDTVFYGGANGFENGDTRSQIYRSGEGFKVTGFPDKEIAKTVKFVARYVETTANRSQFDKFVNDVVVNGNVYSILKDKTYYKKLVFTMSGENSGNYTFKVKVGSIEIDANGLTATVFDKDDTANKGEQNSGINIEITVKALKANYQNTAQSYANADNTYNTNWLDVTGTDATKAGLSIKVVNGWMYENGKDGVKKQYEKYTVIRGRAGSDVLSASIEPKTDGSHINYRLSNQPILTIGYFVDTKDFPIGSMASLMIATYYQQASNPEFSKPIIAETTWKLAATAEQYESGTGMPEGYDTWDAYFEYLETEAGGKHYVFLNTAETEAGWGYYEVSAEQGTANKYDSFKQVANVSGILTEQDINILDNFFALYTYGEDGHVTSTQRKEWGVGKTYIDNFLNVGAGNVAVVLGSIFTGEFTGTYDGNGYTINHVNIMGLVDDTNVGMFANIATKDGKTGSVKNVHLRNFSIIANCASENTYNVGGIAGMSVSALENCTFHGSITVNGNGATINVGGIVGSASANITGAIVLGNIDVTNSGTSNVGGVVGSATSSITLNGVVSMIEILANGNVGAIVGSGSIPDSNVTNVYYLANSAYKVTTTDSGTKFDNADDDTTESIGTAVSYDNLMAGSASGYLETAKTYDAIANVEIIEGQDGTKPAARESMHLQDIVKVYLLMYSQTDSGNGYLTVSESSWLVGTADGTTTHPIVIANQQDVALLRQFRFATFTLANDVEMYSTRPNTVFDGVFYGTVEANGHTITIHKNGTTTEKMFDMTVGTALPITWVE